MFIYNWLVSYFVKLPGKNECPDPCVTYTPKFICVEIGNLSPGLQEEVGGSQVI